MAIAIKPASPRLRRRRSARIIAAWPLADRGQPSRDHVARNDLTFSGGAAWTTGPDGPAVSFDGAAASYLKPLVPLGINPAAQDFSIACWFMCSSFNTTNTTIFAQEDGAGTGRSWIFTGASGLLSTNLNGVTTTGGTLALNTWYHVALACVAGKTWTVYLNGVPAISLTGTQTSNLGNLRVGNWKLASAGGGLIGQVGRSGVVVRGGALAPGEVLRLATEAYWLWTPRRRWAAFTAAPAAPLGRKVPWHLFFNRSA
jgi:concanavalin A-like lectin/glucanase superfamily protein